MWSGEIPTPIKLPETPAPSNQPAHDPLLEQKIASKISENEAKISTLQETVPNTGETQVQADTPANTTETTPKVSGSCKGKNPKFDERCNSKGFDDCVKKGHARKSRRKNKCMWVKPADQAGGVVKAKFQWKIIENKMKRKITKNLQKA